MSIVTVGPHRGVIGVSITEGRAKFNNLAHNPECSILVSAADWWSGFIVFDGTAELLNAGSVGASALRFGVAAIPAIVGDLKTRLVEMWGPRLVKLALFGSRARGDYAADSDIDVAIVNAGLDRAGKMAVLDVVAELEFEQATAISALVMSADAFADLLSHERRIALDIEREGVPI